MAGGMNSLPGNFMMGSPADSSSSTPDFSYSLLNSMNENTDLLSVTGGHYRSTTYGDIVFAASDGLHWRAYNGSDDFNGSVVFGATDTVNYIYSLDVTRDGYDDVVGLGTAAASASDPSAAFVVAYAGIAGTSASSSSAPFGNAVLSYIPAGDMVLDSTEAGFVSLHDMAFADFNNDGIQDVIVAGVNAYTRTTNGTGEQPPDTTEYLMGAYAIGLGTGNGHFDFQPFQYTDTNFSGTDAFIGLETSVDARVSAGDFNGDGYVDVAFGYHPVDGAPVVLGGAPAFIVWGVATSSSDAPMLNTDSSNTYSNGWNGPNDVQAVRPSGGSGADQLVITFDSTAHIAAFNSDKTLDTDNEARSIPRGPMGTPLDYDGDGEADFMFLDGNSSTIGVQYDWGGTSGDIDQHGGITLGTDIAGGVGLDYNGDGKNDFVGAYDQHVNVYTNTTTSSSDAVGIALVEDQRVDDAAINGVDPGFVTSLGFTGFRLDVVGGRSLFDNALGFVVIDAEGDFGDARFIDIDAAATSPVELGVIGPGARIALFMVADGLAQNEDLSGEFRFLDAATGDPATIGSRTPVLAGNGGIGPVVVGDIFHTADASAYDFVNPLNAGGRVQTLSREDAASDALLIGFEDSAIGMGGDGDFNDLVVRLSSYEVFPV